jgi:hypothetical protein
VFDVRDLEVRAERGDWGAAPDAVRSACALLVSLVALAVLRAWMVLAEWPEFMRVYGRNRHLDMGSASGWTMAELHTPGQWSALLDLGVVLASCLLVLGVLHRVSECRTFGVVLAVALLLDTLSSLAYPVPWFYLVATSMLALAALVLVVLLLRRRTAMHLRPEPGNLHESVPVVRAQPPRPTPPTWPGS